MTTQKKRSFLSWVMISFLLPLVSPNIGAQTLLKTLQKQHHYEVGYAKNGDVLVLKLINSTNGNPIFTAYPFGSDDDLKRIHRHARLNHSEYLKLANKIRRKYKPQIKPQMHSLAAPATIDFRKGLGLGYSETAGYIGGQSVCYHFTTEVNGHQSRTSFSSSQTASTLASQFNLGVSVDLSLSFFKANNDFSFSNNYQNTTNSGRLTYSAGSIYSANNVLVELSPFGNQALTANMFESQCGTDFVNSIQVGMVVFGEVSWSSTNSEANQKIEDKLKIETGFGGLSAAVTTASSVQNSQSEFQFNLIVLGGGSEASIEIENAYSAALDQRNKCLQELNANACATFTNALESATISAIGKFDKQMQPENLPMDLGFLQPFPDGVKGFPQATALIHTPAAILIKDLTAPSYLKPYNTGIQSALAILSDLSILKNRASYLYGKLYDPLTKTNIFNPFPMQDIANNYLAPMVSSYLGLRTELVTLLQNCLQARQDNVDAQCKPIQDLVGYQTRNYIAHRCIGNDQCSPDAFQNWGALQYVGLYNDPKGGFPLDFVYTGKIGSNWASKAGNIPPPGAAMIGFIDSKYVYDQVMGVSDPWATILAFGKTNDNSLMYQSPPPVISPFYAFNRTAWAPQNGFAPLTIGIAGGCTSQGFGQTMCPLSLGSDTPSTFNGSVGRMSLSIFPIQDFFAH